MRIARLQINGFRGIKEADIRLGETCVLIGPNSVGKTTIIEALALLLGRDGMVRGLTEHDFYGSNPAANDRIKITATVVGFPSQNPDHLPEWFSLKRGGVPKWCDPNTGDLSATPRAAPYELACQIGFQARFDHDNLEVETLRYFCDDATADDVFVDDTVTHVGIGLVRDIGLFLIPASRSWDRMISFGSELFRRVVSSDNGLPSQTILAERDKLRSPANPLENDPRLKAVIDEVNKEIASLFGTERSIKLRLTQTDSASVLDSVVPHFGTTSDLAVPSKREGSGLISLQSLFLLLHFGNRRVAEGKGFCLALEEPELHLPPMLQRRVLRGLKALATQVIVSTHSPLIAGFSDPTEVLLVSNIGGELKAKPLLDKPLDSATPNAIRTLMQIRRVELVTALMAETVMVPEGATDFDWLALLARIIEIQSDPALPGAVFSSTTGVIPTQSAAVVETTKRLRDIHGRTVPLVDGDRAGCDYVKELSSENITRILQWPRDWTIEDVVGWIISSDQAAILDELRMTLALPPSDLANLVLRLKSDDKGDPQHLKGDRVAYEAIAQAIGHSNGAVNRVGELLDGIAIVAQGGVTQRFKMDGQSLVFQP